MFLPGIVSNPFPFFRRSEFFVLSSHFEGLPTVVIEALAAGLPVISYQCPYGPQEILEDGKWGRLVSHDDVAALAQAIGRGIGEPAWLEPFRASGPERAKAYAVDAAVRRFEKIFLEVAQS